MDTDNSVVIAGERGIKGLSGNGKKNTIKIKLKKTKKAEKTYEYNIYAKLHSTKRKAY